MPDDIPEGVQVIDFTAPESIPASAMCGARIAVPGRGDYPHCQLAAGHAAWHRWVHPLDGIEGEMEYRWS